MTSREGSNMQKPDWLTNNINLGNVLTLVAMLAGGSYAYGSLNNRMETMEAYRTERVRQTDEKFSAITRALEGLPNLSYRVTAQEEALKATNQRVDVSLANISQRLGEINQALGALDTKVAVLTQRIEASAPPRRASLGVDNDDPPG